MSQNSQKDEASNDSIMIIDDNPANLNVLSEILKGAGYRVRAASNAEIALRSIELKQPLLILMDIKMPGMNGFQLCEKLKADKKTAEIPVVFCSALEDWHHRISGFQSGGVDYICKPINAEEVLVRVKTHCNLRKALIELEDSNQKLAEEIKERHRIEAELIRHQDYLEEIVGERTKELETKNFLLAEEIKERKKTEAELIVARDRAEKADKVKSLFLSNISHELRTPMNGIMGFTSLLSYSNLNAEQLEYNENVSESANRLLILINDLLNFSNLNSNRMKLEKKQFSILEAYKHSESLITRTFNKKEVRLVSDIDCFLPRFVVGDPHLLKQVLAQLLSNAVKFTPGGVIKTEIRQISNENGISKISIIVSDQGMGIPSEKFDEIFEMFHQLDDSFTKKFGGAGVGLSIVRGFVELMGGEISVESQPGKGSSFTVTLPFEICDRPSQTSHEIKTEVSGGKPQKVPAVLIAEDDLINLMLITKIFNRFQWKCMTANDGREAFEIYKNNDFDSVIMDIHMPELNGIEASIKIREFEKNSGKKRVPIIAFTAYADHGDREAFLSAGMDDVMTKPLTDEKTLRDTLLKHIRGAQADAYFFE